MGVSHTDHRSRIDYFDESFAKLQSSLDRAIPDSRNYIRSFSKDMRKLVVHSSNSREPGMLLLWDRDAKTMDPIGWFNENLDPDILADVKAVEYESADGYGWEFRHAGRGQWGGIMQDDVDAGARWLVDEGIADSNEYVGGTVWSRHIGLAGENSRSVSPYHQVERFESPFLIIHAQDDHCVRFGQADQMYKALVKNDKSAKLVKVDHGGHSMVNAAARKLLLDEIEYFLRENNAGR